MAGYGGTLAAVRCLGRAGVPVTVALGAPGQPAAWSRWTTRRVWCPGAPDSERFMDRLLRFGEDEPGHVLYPTCDDLAYAFARRREEVRKSFLTYQPPAPVLLGLLDKKSLLFAARSAGIGSARTWFPDGEAGLTRIAREARFPLLIKPRTQLLWPSLHKGTRVDRREDLIRAYTEYRRLRSHAPALLAERPDAAWPMLQEYHVEAEERLESVAGFIDASGEVFVARAATKVLQYPRRVGIGVCFEDAPLDPDAARGIAALCRNSGYFGVFEAEFIRSGERRLLIDFNPRYYNQMGFEIARGLPLPLLVHAAACRDDERLRALARDAQRPHTERARAYCHRFLLALILGGQRLSGRMASGDTERWRAWQGRHRSQLVDGAFDPEDKTPGLLAAAWQLWPALRRPRAFFRSIALNE
jgi:predicted ATP-grasp superfamily ATP-dependent carboligase